METVCYVKLSHMNFSNRLGYDGPGYCHADQQYEQNNKHTDVSENEGPDNPGPVVLHNDDGGSFLIFL